MISFFTSFGHRDVLSADRNYFVRTNGNDSNLGTSNTPGGAWLTIQKALNFVAGLDFNGFNCNVNVADGTYTGANVFKNYPTNGALNLIGNTATPANCIINPTSNHCFTINPSISNLNLKGFRLTTNVSGYGIVAQPGSIASLYNIVFGPCPGGSGHIFLSGYSQLYMKTNYNIETGGNATYHIIAGGAGGFFYSSGLTLTLGGGPSPAFNTFIECFNGYFFVDAMTFVGTATGKRYDVIQNGVIFTGAGGANYLPGNAAGTSASGGQYV